MQIAAYFRNVNREKQILHSKKFRKCSKIGASLAKKIIR